MTKGRIDKKQRQDDQRKKRLQAAPARATGAKRSPPPVGLSRAASEPLPPHSYPVTRAAIGKRQTPGGG